MAPVGTPEPILTKLNRSIQAAVSSQVVRDQYLTLGIEAVDKSGPANMAEVMEAERVRLGGLIKAANIKAD